jgi:thiamine-phosphate pyrophosphorylase
VSTDAIYERRRRQFADARLYFVCDARPNGADPTPLLDAALRGGADVIQLREKAPRCAEELISFSAPFARAAREHGALFILNDRPDLVSDCGADGVHVGQDDEPVAEARADAGAGAVVGLSTHSPEQVDAAREATDADRPDQISVGPVWETPTKAGRPAAGLELIGRAASGRDDPPWFAIGGIDTTNVGEVVAAGATRIVVVRAIRDAGDPEAAARALRAALPD